MRGHTVKILNRHLHGDEKYAAVKMELPFATFTEVGVHSTIRVLTEHGKMGQEIQQEVNVLYGAGCMSKTRVYEWQNMFLCGRMNLTDEE